MASEHTVCAMSLTGNGVYQRKITVRPQYAFPLAGIGKISLSGESGAT